MPEGLYYSPEVETLERCDLDALIDERVRYTVQYAAGYSPFYRNWFRENNINPEEIREHEDLLSLPEILDPNERAFARANNSEGVGVAEAPRGTLIHHYKVDSNGLITWANLIIATGHNNAAMNRGVLQAARHFVHGNKLTEGMLNRVEAVIRTFDPCLSCSTHADGRMALEVSLRTHDGELLDSIRN